MLSLILFILGAALGDTYTLGAVIANGSHMVSYLYLILIIIVVFIVGLSGTSLGLQMSRGSSSLQSLMMGMAGSGMGILTGLWIILRTVIMYILLYFLSMTDKTITEFNQLPATTILAILLFFILYYTKTSKVSISRS